MWPRKGTKRRKSRLEKCRNFFAACEQFRLLQYKGIKKSWVLRVFLLSGGYFCNWLLGFGFRISFGLRIWGFGFRVYLHKKSEARDEPYMISFKSPAAFTPSDAEGNTWASAPIG